MVDLAAGGAHGLVGILLLLLTGAFTEVRGDSPAPASGPYSAQATPPVPVEAQNEKRNLAGSGQEKAEVPPEARPFQLIYTNGHLFGDWGGLRTRLQELGITPSLTLVTDIAGNPSGGLRRGATESSNLGLDLQFNLEKIFDLKGGSFELSLSDRFGSSLTKDYIGNAFNVQQDFGGETFKIIDAAYLQTLFDDRVEFRVGRLAAGDDFYVSAYDYLFMQNGLCGNPVGVFFNAPGMTAYPNANWGGWLKVKPTPRSHVMAGVYNGDPLPRENDRHGVDGSFNGPLFAIAEAGYEVNGLKGDTGPAGDYKVGLWYDAGRYADFNRGNKRGNTGYYALFDQALVPFGDKRSGRGLGVFGSALISPDQSISQLPYFFTAGVAARGVLEDRPNDACGFAAIYGHFSGDLNMQEQRADLTAPAVFTQRDETVMELTYRCYLGNGGVFVQPDAQYILHPDGSTRIHDAAVLGCQIGIDF